MSKFTGFLKNQSGATAIEYALIAGTTGLILIAVMPLIGTALTTVFTDLASAM